MLLVVGLGNPGPSYAGTRHNAGFLVVDELARRHEGRFRQARNADLARLPGAAMVLAKPRSYMNLSGQAVQALLTRERAAPGSLLVVHDDMDLPLGRLRFKQRGGAGGQRGVQDIIDHIGQGFARLKVGVSRPPAGWASERWVLSRFREDELELLGRVVSAAADAVETLSLHGLEAAMGAVNGLDLVAG